LFFFVFFMNHKIMYKYWFISYDMHSHTCDIYSCVTMLVYFSKLFKIYFLPFISYMHPSDDFWWSIWWFLVCSSVVLSTYNAPSESCFTAKSFLVRLARFSLPQCPKWIIISTNTYKTEIIKNHYKIVDFIDHALFILK
jgi:hypothetical protein